MGKYDGNPIIEGRYDAYGRKTYWNAGYKGKGVKVAVIDEFGVEHGHQMASVSEYIAPECEVIRLEMGANSYYAIIDRLKDALKLGVDIISISRSSEVNTAPMYEAIKACYDAGMLIVCSAGNDGDKYHDSVDIVKYPAAYNETVSVLSIDNTFTPSSFSSHGSTGTVTGFGQNVLVKNKDGEEMLVNGTSPTTAAVAFTMALYLCKLKSEGKPKPYSKELIEFVKSSTVDYSIVGRDNMTGYGFFTLDKTEHERVRMMILDMDSDGVSERVERIRDLIKSGMATEDAEATVNKEYFIVGYEIISGVKIPVYGGRRPM